MTGVYLPVAQPSASAWQLSDWRELQLRSEPAAGGVATIDVGQLDSDVQWLIDRAVVAMESATSTQVRFYVNTVHALGLRDGSSRGNFDVTEYPQGLLVRPGTTLVAQWTGASDGAIGVLTLQAREFRRS